MCFNAPISWMTLIIGTIFNIFNIFYFNNATITATSLLWQWVLLMQLFDAIGWMNQPAGGPGSNNCNSTNKFVANGAFLANVTQPIVLALLFFALQGDLISQENKILAASVTLIYTLWLVYSSNQIDEVNCLRPNTGCSNLAYSWWEQFPGSASMYMLALVLLILLLARPMKFALMQLTYITLTFIISSYVYKCGGVPSVWCALAGLAPVLVGPMWYLSQ